MKRNPVIAVLYAPGTNCHEETREAIDLAGGIGDVVNLQQLLQEPLRLQDYHALVIPGGFSWGDHIAAGRVFAVHLMAQLADQLTEFIAARKPILGICNGDQVLMETGILPTGDVTSPQSALVQNRSARFESRWVHLVAADAGFWTMGLENKILCIPVAHGEGRLHARPNNDLKPAFLYASEAGEPTEEYPDNPAGSPDGIAGITDKTGIVMGMMPHPERAALPVHPSQDGLRIFRNLVYYCQQL